MEMILMLMKTVIENMPPAFLYNIPECNRKIKEKIIIL
jgi:hypothetical protein